MRTHDVPINSVGVCLSHVCMPSTDSPGGDRPDRTYIIAEYGRPFSGEVLSFYEKLV